MFTPDFWETENKIGNALYRINQSPYKDYCEIDELFVFRLRELKNFLNTQGIKKEVKYKVLEIIGELQDDEYYSIDDEYHDLDDGGIING